MSMTSVKVTSPSENLPMRSMSRTRHKFCLAAAVSIILAACSDPIANQGAPTANATSPQTPEVTETNRRRMDIASLQHEHDEMVAQLIATIEEDHSTGYKTPRELAARTLGRWHAIETIPVLLDHITVEVTPFPVIAWKSFYLEKYPCAKAIADMGPSALRPTLTELAVRAQPLNEGEVTIAAQIVLALCDNSNEKAIQAIQEVEQTFDTPTNLASIRKHIRQLIDAKATRAGPTT